jgi:hypothetical protein
LFGGPIPRADDVLDGLQGAMDAFNMIEGRVNTAVFGTLGIGKFDLGDFGPTRKKFDSLTTGPG